MEVKKKINSRAKGAVGEREFAALCRERGYEVTRTAQHCGKTGQAPDVKGLPHIHTEVKRVEALNLYGAMEQANRDNNAGGAKNIPIVAHRKNNQKWLIVMEADKWFEFYQAYLKGVGDEQYQKP